MASALFSGCAMDELEDNRDTEYGYVQFKLYKDASYSPGTKALTSVLDNLSDASKIEVTMESSEGQDLIQTLTLSAADKDLAEYGMRSSKLRVLAGNYRVLSYRLFDGTDDELYHGSAGANTDFTVVPGGLTVHDLTANAVEKGFVRFRIIKDLSGFNPPGTRASSRTEYTFDKIDSVYIEVRATGGSAQTEFFGLKVDYAQHFASEDIEGNPVEGNDKEPGYITSSAMCDSLIRINGGTYQRLPARTLRIRAGRKAGIHCQRQRGGDGRRKGVAGRSRCIHKGLLCPPGNMGKPRRSGLVVQGADLHHRVQLELRQGP